MNLLQDLVLREPRLAELVSSQPPAATACTPLGQSLCLPAACP